MRVRSLLGCIALVGCAAPNDKTASPAASLDASIADTRDGSSDETLGETADPFADVTLDDSRPDTGPLMPDAACVSVAEEAKAEQLPVDIVFIVDNSASMEKPSASVKAGLNDFAKLIAAKSLDYKVIMLALRNKTSPITFMGGTRYPICIPPPLAGDDNCGNGPRFHHSDVDIKSTQPLEQFLGILGQTKGYKVGDTGGRGGEPFADQLRPTATKTIVIVTDDESRLSATEFETFAGGPNPNNSSLELPAGVLHPSRKGQFDGYVFAGIYGWSSLTDPSVKCKFGDGTSPASAGPTYTTLVTKTSGPRAKLCDPAAWTPFFDAVASAVIKKAKLACEIAIPPPKSGTLDPTQVNVEIVGDMGPTLIPKVKDAASCGTDLGWYYDDDLMPKKVILCPAACDKAQASVGIDKSGKINVLFGCKTVSVIK